MVGVLRMHVTAKAAGAQLESARREYGGPQGYRKVLSASSNEARLSGGGSMLEQAGATELVEAVELIGDGMFFSC